ncbi:protein TolR [Stenotrophomonas mori]|uniref:Tol-Pal system protein TolR n=1 Tax=Stenotrophomonas mori TaxID=2871096 RepID=A0ABT0SE91_9GAMM|nr:protein TolR [Stenotrophomonas mori]MCL7713359.1 protein TolR [Stenotrophomonas mori]
MMSGISRRKKRKLKSEINVVPYIDVMLVLLIIFMVTAPLLTLSFEVELPTSHAKALESKQDPVVVSVLSDGQLSLKLPDAKAPERMAAETLQAQLAAMASQDKSLRVIVAADRSVTYEKVVAAMDVIKAARIEKVGLATDAR